MKKILLLLGITCLSLNNTAFGYETYNVPETLPHTYQFNVFAPFEDEDCTREYPFSQNELISIFQAGIVWREILNLVPLHPAIYSIKPEKDYNAHASSQYVKIAESPYKVTQINAVLNNKTITSPESEIDIDSDGQITIGVGITKGYEGWSTSIEKKSLFDGLYSDLLSISKHEYMHSLGLATNAAKYWKNCTGFVIVALV